MGDNAVMRYRRAVEKSRVLANACQRATLMPLEEPFLHGAYVFGEVLDGVDDLQTIKVAFTLNLTPEEVPWGTRPQGTSWLVDTLRLDKGGFQYWQRTAQALERAMAHLRGVHDAVLGS